MSTNKRPVPPHGQAVSETDHIVKKEKLEEDPTVKEGTFDRETDEEETGGDRDVSALKQETDDEAEAKKEAVKKEPDDEIEADDELQQHWDYFLQRLQSEVELAIAALKAKQDADEAEIIELGRDLDENLREAQHTLHVGEKLRREVRYKENPAAKRMDKKTFYWCENQYDNNKSFLLLPKLKYYDWRDFRACPTWDDMRSCVSKDFYESVIMKRRNDLLSPNGHVDKDQKKRLEKSSEDGTKFYCGTTFRKDIHEGMSGDLYSEQFGDVGEGDDRFPPYIEQIMYDLYDSDKEFDWLDEYIGIEEGGHRFQGQG